MIQHHTSELLDRTPPCSLESEEALLGALILDASRFDAVTREVTAIDFYDDANRDLFGVIQTLHDANKPYGDMAILVAAVKSLGLYEKIGAARLAKLFGYGTASHAIYYAKQVRQASRLRQQLNIGKDLIRRVYEQDAKPDSIANWLDAKLIELSVDDSTSVQSVGELAREVLDDIDVGRGPRRGLMTGFPSVDEVMGVFIGGETVVIGARPGNGKTAFAMQVAEHNARRGKRGMFVSLEMTGRELTQRLQCSIAGVNQTRVRNGTITSAEQRALIEAASDLDGMSIDIWAPPGATIADIRGTARMQKKMHGLDLLVIDYLGLIKSSDSRMIRPYEITTDISRRVKELARELEVPVLLLCQFSRDSDKSNREPRMSDLRDSGAIEQDADQIILLHRVEDSGETKVIIDKNRHGARGHVNLTFNGARTRFEDKVAPAEATS